MQLSNATRNVSTIGIQRTRKFTLKPGAHIMAMLSGIYKDPRDANVREYLSNMYDAYVPLIKAGIAYKNPILRVPTKLNPVLEFQDFGIGMDFDTVWSVYAEYGNSTKNADNDAVGGFGIGSKTAFCYNNGAAWNIVATKDGVTNYFQAFVGQDGVPDLNHVGETREGLPNGVTVSIPVRVEDVDSFQKAAHKYVPYFPMELEVEGMAEVPVKPTYTFRGTDWGFKGRKSHATNVVMGNVPYELDLGSIPNIRHALTNPQYQFFVYNNLDLFVPIGAVDVVPSRDALQMTDKTAKFLIALFNKVWAEVPTIIGDQISKSKSLWEATVARMTAISQISGLSSDVVKGVKWNGQVLEDDLSLDLTTLRKGVDIRDLTEYAIRNTDVATPEVDEKVEKIHLLVPDLRNDGTRKHFTAIIINDTKGKAANLARGYVRQNYVAISSWSKRVQRYGHTKCKVYTLSTKNSVDEIRTALQGFDGPILLASALSGSVPKVGSAKAGNLYKWNGRGGFDARVLTPTGAAEYHYVVLTKDGHSGRYFYSNNGWRRNESVNSLISAAGTLNITVDDLYGIRPEDVDDLGTEWHNLEALVSDGAVKYIQTNLVGADVFHKNREYYSSKQVRFFNDVVKNLPGVTAVDIVNDIKTLTDSANLQGKHDQFIRYLNDGIKTEKYLKPVTDALTPKKGAVTDLNLNRRIEDLVKQYPVLHVTWELFREGGYYHTDFIKKAVKKVGV